MSFGANRKLLLWFALGTRSPAEKYTHISVGTGSKPVVTGANTVISDLSLEASPYPFFCVARRCISLTLLAPFPMDSLSNPYCTSKTGENDMITGMRRRRCSGRQSSIDNKYSTDR